MRVAGVPVGTALPAFMVKRSQGGAKGARQPSSPSALRLSEAEEGAPPKLAVWYLPSGESPATGATFGLLLPVLGSITGVLDVVDFVNPVVAIGRVQVCLCCCVGLQTIAIDVSFDNLGGLVFLGKVTRSNWS